MIGYLTRIRRFNRPSIMLVGAYISNKVVDKGSIYNPNNGTLAMAEYVGFKGHCHNAALVSSRDVFFKVTHPSGIGKPTILWYQIHLLGLCILLSNATHKKNWGVGYTEELTHQNRPCASCHNTDKRASNSLI